MTLRKRRGAGLPKKRKKRFGFNDPERDKILYGSLGAASPVRRIDPKTGLVIAVIDSETGLPMRPSIKRA